MYGNGDEHGCSGPPSSVHRKDACVSVEPNSIVPVVAVPPVAGGALVIVTSGATSVPLTNSNSAGVESGVPSSPTAKTWNRCSPNGTFVYSCGDVHSVKVVVSRAHMNVVPVPVNSKLKDVAVVSKSGPAIAGVTDANVVSGSASTVNSYAGCGAGVSSWLPAMSSARTRNVYVACRQVGVRDVVEEGVVGRGLAALLPDDGVAGGRVGEGALELELEGGAEVVVAAEGEPQAGLEELLRSDLLRAEEVGLGRGDVLHRPGVGGR